VREDWEGARGVGGVGGVGSGHVSKSKLNWAVKPPTDATLKDTTTLSLSPWLSAIGIFV